MQNHSQHLAFDVCVFFFLRVNVCQRSADVVHPDVSDSQMDEFSHRSFTEVGTSQGIKAEEMLMGDEKRRR